MLNHCQKRGKARQSGAVLITGLIFMVVLTIIVISALRSATLDERMAANASNRMIALQAAEAVMRDAEARLPPMGAGAPFDPYTPATFSIACTNGLCRMPVLASTPRWQTIDWLDTSLAAPTATFALATSNLVGVAAQPRYIVEIDKPATGGTPTSCSAVEYRITARGVGMDNSAVFVQALFKHQPEDC